MVTEWGGGRGADARMLRSNMYTCRYKFKAPRGAKQVKKSRCHPPAFGSDYSVIRENEGSYKDEERGYGLSY